MKRVYTPTKKKTILIVDDDQIVVHLYQENLLGRGFKVEVATDGAQALRVLQQGGISLVILDLCLPRTNGVELLGDIRAEFPSGALPVIVCSNSYLGRQAREAEAAGATRVLSKLENSPADMVTLISQLLDGQAEPGRESEVMAEAPVPHNLLATFLDQARQALARMRTGYLALARTEEEKLRSEELMEIHERTHTLAGAAAALGFGKIAQLANGVEALLIELREKPKKITASVVNTLGQAIDMLALLTEEATASIPQSLGSPRILVVDDEVISREAICSALSRAKLAAVSLGDPLAAEQLLKEEHFDLIFLDVEMPGKSGLELCLGLREIPLNRTTPVVFVTAHSDFGTQARSVLSGGKDFIVKPFILVELAVKALTWLCRQSLQPQLPAVSQSAPVPIASIDAGLQLAKSAELSVH
ncbi:MAG: response regulator [Collimonas sp.]|uniref:response regulator n=1 Tax=Collimonas sp. TaxID=1963772 RepID=UPI003266E39A